MKRWLSIPIRLAITALVFCAGCSALGFGVDYVIDVLAEQRLFTEITQTAQILKNTLNEFQLTQTMAKEMTHASYWNSLAMRYVINPPTDLYRETDGWSSIYTAGGNVNQTWSNSTVPVEPDPYYTSGPGTDFASTTATAELADSAAEDSLATVQQFYRNKTANDTARKALQTDFANGGNNTYLGQARIANGIGLQTLSTQQDILTQLVNVTRIQALALKQIRDQDADDNNFITDLHRYQASQGVQIGSGLASEFQSYNLP
jgi:hypothetical protein